MKTRRGFVSNSSTTSFCIYGAQVEQEIVIDFMELLFEKSNEVKKYMKDAGFDDIRTAVENSGCYEYVQLIEKYLSEETGKTFAVYYIEDSCYIGRPAISVGDNETGKEFKDSVKVVIEKYFGKTLKTQYIEESFID